MCAPSCRGICLVMTWVVEDSMEVAVVSMGVAEADTEEEAATDDNPAFSVQVTPGLPMAGAQSRIGNLYRLYLHDSRAQILMLFSWSINVDPVK